MIDVFVIMEVRTFHFKMIIYSFDNEIYSSVKNMLISGKNIYMMKMSHPTEGVTTVQREHVQVFMCPTEGVTTVQREHVQVFLCPTVGVTAV